MPSPTDRPPYGDLEMDTDRVLASPGTIVVSWILVLALMALALVPDLMTRVEQGVIAAARAAQQEFEEQVVRVPVLQRLQPRSAPERDATGEPLGDC